jgi:predicted transposase YbfD/YdcC
LQQRLWGEDVQTARTCNKGHGRVETRTLTTTTWLNEYLDWPRVGQAFRLVRERRVKGQTTVEVVYGITSLSRHEADAGRLLGLTRAHWGIENRLHYTRDETLGEDRCRVRKGNSPRVLASLRNVAIHLLRGIDAPSLAAATRRLAACPQESLKLLYHPASTSE